MAFLTDDSIRKYIFDEKIPDEKRIKITPKLNESQIGQCSIDLTLSEQFARFRKPFFNPFSSKEFDLRNKTKRKEIQKTWYKYYTRTEEEGIKIRPNEVVIAITKEWVRLPKNMCGLITGRSSFSRMGIEVQLTQDLHQPGHNAQILLQIKNNSPFSIRLYPNMRIAQLMIGLLDKDCNVSYDENPNSKYVGDKRGIVANWFQDFELENKNLISKSTYSKVLLDAMLICLTIITIAFTIKKLFSNIGEIDVSLLILIGITMIVGVLRTVVYFKN